MRQVRLGSLALCVSLCALVAAGAVLSGPPDPNAPSPPGGTGPGTPSAPWHDDPKNPRQQDAKALEILKAGIKALGGEEAILGRKTIFIKREITNHDYPEPVVSTVSIWYKRPDKFRKEISHPPDPVKVEAYDGQVAWFDDGTGARISSKTRAGAIRDGMQEMDLPVNYLDAELTYFNISQEIPGKLAHVVKVRKDGYTKELMFDVSTNLLQVAGQYENPWGADDKMVRFDRYRPVDGVLIPYREERWRANRMVTESEIKEVKFNGPMDDSLFRVPVNATASKP